MSFDVDVCKRLGDRDIALRFRSERGITALFGPSSVGKTSVLHMVAGVLRPDRGHIEAGGVILYDSASSVWLPPEHRRAGFIFQDGRLFPHMTVRSNLLYGARIRGHGRLSFEEVVEFLGIGALLDRRPATLSGGEAQRVSVGRALLSNPLFLLMDEPLTYLDGARRNELLSIIARLRDEWALPILYVTHDRSELERLDAQVVEMTFD